LTEELSLLEALTWVDKPATITVTDSVEEVCVDPGERWPSWKLGESGDPAYQEGERADSWHWTVEEGRHCKMPKNTGDGLVTTPSHVYAQSMYNCTLCISYRINNHNRNHVLLYYLFQENKSFGSKKPFAFILWRTRTITTCQPIWGHPGTTASTHPTTAPKRKGDNITGQPKGRRRIKVLSTI
jgi:hypothetical protein